MNEQLLSQARAIGPDLHTIFQEIHEHPELGNREERTAALIRQCLVLCPLPRRQGFPMLPRPPA